VAAINWLGRDAFGGPAAFPDFAAGWNMGRHMELVRDARRYGFHATLKAPFMLAANATEQDLLDAFAELRLTSEDIVIPSLVLRQIDGFFALVPEQPSNLLNEFAELLVREFDRFRAPLTSGDIARRNPDGLSERQLGYLELWGYPYVFEEFFFHMTLTGRVCGDEADDVRKALEQHFAGFVGKPHLLSHIAIFCEPAPGADFAVRSIRTVSNPRSNGKA
jgi:hypothetical protein